MSYRLGLFESITQVEHYIRFRPTYHAYPAELFHKISSFLTEKRPPPHQLLVDVGCGSGQGTYSLSSQFERVIGFDVSKAQVDAATRANTAPNVEFKVSPAEVLPLEDQSVDLITCSLAVHLFDFHAFCEECRRVLKPSGCLAIINYGKLMMNHKNEDVRNKLAEYSDELFKKRLGPYWDPRAKISYDNLIGYEIPFPEFVRDDLLELRLQWSVSHLIGYIQSLSSYTKYLENNPSGKILEEYQKKFMSAVASPGSSSEDTMVEIVAPLTLLLGRNS
ncbi:putative methyltransferase DDB_G0268948 [Lytechinus variegatus]|uniref:putative methyltransferase DDB_G0268948 n=1 Tax=Lytechinus variegatus TaxID=7654 RepID=UPI001BB12C98|nr:putative methyltransferase DDB_G0268948 [Lytechinus variegatus]XP_041473850.1 putative methyltransferase DDB_G0268948 [Lytechinus variegatus]